MHAERQHPRLLRRLAVELVERVLARLSMASDSCNPVSMIVMSFSSTEYGIDSSGFVAVFTQNGWSSITQSPNQVKPFAAMCSGVAQVWPRPGPSQPVGR